MAINRMSSDNNLQIQQTPIQDGMATEGHYAETDRGLTTTEQK